MCFFPHLQRPGDRVVVVFLRRAQYVALAVDHEHAIVEELVHTTGDVSGQRIAALAFAWVILSTLNSAMSVVVMTGLVRSGKYYLTTLMVIPPSTFTACPVTFGFVAK